MDVVGSEIGQKMRSAIKAKLTELGCYVDDELPDYVMVMVANKRTRSQMEEDLQLFLGDNTMVFVNWLHQVLKKLQEVTVAPTTKPTEKEKSQERSKSKEKKSKDKKERTKTKKSDTAKKAKKKDRVHKKKEKIEKKKGKKKSKHHEMIHPNVPPLLMNIEKNSEPSITDVFAGQILKNHGVVSDNSKTEENEKKPNLKELKRPMLPIIDPKTIVSQCEPTFMNVVQLSGVLPGNDQIKEMNDIESKIAGLKQKLQDQLDSMSDDEDFLNIRTEAEELMNDFAEDVVQEITETAPETPPIKKVVPPLEKEKPLEVPTPPSPTPEPETLPLIELRLPKRPVRERLGARNDKKPEPTKAPDTKAKSPERFTPEREPVRPSLSKSAKSRLGDLPKREKKESSVSEEAIDRPEASSKRITSKVASQASVVRVRPRVRAPASSLLLRAVADAHRSLLNIPPKIDTEKNKIKRGIVLPMRRSVEPQKIVIQVPQDDCSDHVSLGDVDIESDDDKPHKSFLEPAKEEYIPASLTKKFINTDYVPSCRVQDRIERKDVLNLDPVIIHNPTVGKEKDTQFIVTMEGFNPNLFLVKKLLTEGILDDESSKETPKENTIEIPRVHESETATRNEDKLKDKVTKTVEDEGKSESYKNIDKAKKSEVVSINKLKKRLSDTSEESDTQVIIQPGDKGTKTPEVETLKPDSSQTRKRKASPIVFDVSKKEKDGNSVKRERTESASSDSHVTVSTNVSTHKYDALPALSTAERKSQIPCRSFPACRFGGTCAFLHPRCKFAHLCSRADCLYSHPAALPPAAAVASHVVPAANYKSISSTLPSLCKFYPSCGNPACHYFHPKPCRYGKACGNKLECNFYHADVASSKWKYA